MSDEEGEKKNPQTSLLSHGPLITLLPHRRQPGHLIPQEDDLELRKPGRDVLAGLGFGAEGVEAAAEVFVVGLALGLDGEEAGAQGHRLVASSPSSSSSAAALALALGEGELPGQLPGLPVEDFGAGVGVEEVAVSGLQLGEAFVEAAARVDDVDNEYQLAIGNMNPHEGDEVVDEEVVDVGEGFDGRGGRVRGEGDAGLEDLVRGGRAVV